MSHLLELTEMRLEISFKCDTADNEIMYHVCEVPKERVFKLERKKILVINLFILFSIYFVPNRIQRVDPLSVC